MSKIGHGESLPPFAGRSITTFVASAKVGNIVSDAHGLWPAQAFIDAHSPGAIGSVLTALLDSATAAGNQRGDIPTPDPRYRGLTSAMRRSMTLVCVGPVLRSPPAASKKGYELLIARNGWGFSPCAVATCRT